MGAGSPGWFGSALITAIVVFGGGTMAAVILGRPVPEALWSIDGAMTTAIVAGAGFFTLRASGAQGMGHLSDALQTVHTLAIGTGNGTTTRGDTPAAPVVSEHVGGQP